MTIFGDRFPSVKSGKLGAGPLCHPVRHLFQVMFRLTENFWKNRSCGFSSIFELPDVMLRGFSLAEHVLRVSSRKCRLKPKRRREPSAEYDDACESENKHTGQEMMQRALMQERLGTPLTP